MQRLVVLIAVLFAFSAVTGGATAHANRTIETIGAPLVVLNVVDHDNVPVPVMVKVQPYGQIALDSGIIIPCGPFHGIPVTTPALPYVPHGDIPTATQADFALAWHSDCPLRPPRLA